MLVDRTSRGFKDSRPFSLDFQIHAVFSYHLLAISRHKMENRRRNAGRTTKRNDDVNEATVSVGNDQVKQRLENIGKKTKQHDNN